MDLVVFFAIMHCDTQAQGSSEFLRIIVAIRNRPLCCMLCFQQFSGARQEQLFDNLISYILPPAQLA